MKTDDLKFDCRFFSGDKPCPAKNLCDRCDSYRPMGKRILILKFASAGDVLRTSALLPALKQKYPESFVTWVTRRPADELLEAQPGLDRVLVFNLETVLSLQAQTFDLVISLDKAPEAAALASMVSAGEKLGFGLDAAGKLFPLDPRSGYAFLLGLDDDLKFRRNKKTYQELIFEMCGLEYRGEPYGLVLNDRERERAAQLFVEHGLDKARAVIGLNTGAGPVFANKHLRSSRLLELIGMLRARLDAAVLLLGGPLEKETNAYIARQGLAGVFDCGCSHSLREFSALVERCSLVITADTLCLHIAVALKRPVVAFFGPTCAQEIDLYSRGRKIVSGAACAPCYRNSCSEQTTCMDMIRLEEIVAAAHEFV